MDTDVHAVSFLMEKGTRLPDIDNDMGADDSAKH